MDVPSTLQLTNRLYPRGSKFCRKLWNGEDALGWNDLDNFLHQNSKSFQFVVLYV